MVEDVRTKYSGHDRRCQGCGSVFTRPLLLRGLPGQKSIGYPQGPSSRVTIFSTGKKNLPLLQFPETQVGVIGDLGVRDGPKDRGSGEVVYSTLEKSRWMPDEVRVNGSESLGRIQ